MNVAAYKLAFCLPLVIARTRQDGSPGAVMYITVTCIHALKDRSICTCGADAAGMLGVFGSGCMCVNSGGGVRMMTIDRTCICRRCHMHEPPGLAIAGVPLLSL